jgi:hypothetical protein
MGRVFFNKRENIENLTADHTALASDSGKTFIILPGATTELTLPTPGTGAANAQEGWTCTVILQSDSGAAASPGDRFEFLSDGSRYFVHGLVADASETPFAQAAG